MGRAFGINTGKKNAKNILVGGPGAKIPLGRQCINRRTILK
jgi:hypothetical protein